MFSKEELLLMLRALNTHWMKLDGLRKVALESGHDTTAEILTGKTWKVLDLETKIEDILKEME